MIKFSSKMSLFCIIVFVSLTGLAFAHDHDDRGSRGASYYGYQNGYMDGFQHGREDWQGRAGYSFESRDYDDALRGYESYMGSRDQYHDAYQNGYRAGYDDGFHNRRSQFEEAYNGPRYPQYQDDDDSRGIYGQRSVAFRVGYQDGLIDGGRDRRHNNDFRPSKHEQYEHADHGYSHDYGPKKEYKREYRQGYVAGYQRGFGEFRGVPNR